MIQYLLDTNIVIWLSEDNPRINKVKDLLFSKQSQIFISTASWWEIVIKIRSKKIETNLDNLRFMAKESNLCELPITDSFIDAYLDLKKIHNDPFDHMLLAQAITSPMRLITGDRILAEYSSLVIVI